MSIWLLYLMTRTETVSIALGAFCGIGLIVTTIGGAFAAMILDDSGTFEEHRGTFFWWIKALVLSFLFSGFLSCLMPSKSDWYLIVGGYYVTHIENIDKLPPDVVGAMNKFLEGYVKEKTGKP